MHTQQRFAALEFLETQEAVRTKAAHIELYGVLFSMVSDQHLKDILYNQQKRMIEGYNFGVNLLQGRGVQLHPHTPELRVYERPQTGLQQPSMPAPNPNATQLSDVSISTIALNLHKAGASMSMQWACECVDPQVRQYHATSANICQEMAWEMFQYMNYRGYYQAPQLADHTMRTMIQAVQPSGQQQPYQTHFNH
ncbi:spore coat protein [Paenibacillus sp. YYML68]|uniref:spore coat protein n=1 Tax=Paenibacillus sp. YYML68 TaxID=2909250 RepID=UPI00248FC0C2|nr:spore coat protein [Paenibacillus sp. YYML68]